MFLPFIPVVIILLVIVLHIFIKLIMFNIELRQERKEFQKLLTDRKYLIPMAHMSYDGSRVMSSWTQYCGPTFEEYHEYKQFIKCIKNDSNFRHKYYHGFECYYPDRIPTPTLEEYLREKYFKNIDTLGRSSRV